MAHNTQEIDFESHIEKYLLIHGYKEGKPDDYDKKLCLVKEDVIEFIHSTQPDAYDKVCLQYGDDTDEKICQRLSKEIETYGTLHVLRKGFNDRGHYKMAFFKPSSGMNQEHYEKYQMNIFRIIRQVKYSAKNENSIDIVLFLNGLPIVTMELKNALTGQFIEDAIKQYKKDRDPREALLRFKRCLVHFAVSTEKVSMTTKLNFDKTRFFPFNLDTENPSNPNGFKTAYLWEDILQRDSLLDIIQNYLHLQTLTETIYDEKKREVIEQSFQAFIFPRYHQLDCVRKLITQVKDDGTGHNYLIQHSAGSGKSNSIAWLAHQLSTFYQYENDTDRLFHSIIVVTDRKVLDKQLQDTIKQFEQVEGVVKKIDKDSKQLRTSLESGKDIIITTLQKFPVVLKLIADENSSLKLEGSRFAVIIDEAHSSQSGEGAKKLKEVLSSNLEDAEIEDELDFELEEMELKEIRLRGQQPHISYFAFTATPKNKTLELFGHKCADGQFRAFHTYTMRQAIEEGFILDVLKNYTTFKRYFKLMKSVENDEQYEKGKAVKLLTRYVDLQPHAIELKTDIILEHFLTTIVNQIEGKARGMVVTRSRLHAVKFYKALKKRMNEKNLPFKPLVAFSGTVKEPDTQAENTENSLNKLPPKTDIKQAFKMPEYRILVVANKYQTGFDEPLLHTMYVDKKLGGVQAVQTLSRLNRTRKGKTDTVVLDFVNESEDIQKAFQPYYQITYLPEETDPNKLYDIKTQLETFQIYNKKQIKEFAKIFYNPEIPSEKLQPILDDVVEIFVKMESEDEKEDFRTLLQSYIRLYAFISQLISFQDIELEELYIFAKHLNKKLPKHKSHMPYDVLDAIDLESLRIQQTFKGKINLKNENGVTPTIQSTIGHKTEDELDFLSNIIKVLNETYGADLSEEDKVDIMNLNENIVKNEGLKSAIENPNNSLNSIKEKFNQIFDEILLEFVNTKVELYNKLTEKQINNIIKDKWFRAYYSQHRDVV